MNLFQGIKERILKTIRWNLEHGNELLLSNESNIHPSVFLKGSSLNGNITLGEGTKLLNGVQIKAVSEVSIGRYSTLNGPNTDIISFINKVKIGSFCSIARNVSIQEFNHKFDGLTTYHIHQNILNNNRNKDIYSNGPIIIGNDVWIGTQCIITSGAKIGNGAVIGANSVVVGEIPAYAVAIGSPAKVIKYRFDEPTRKKVENLNWWSWDIEKIKRNWKLFGNINELKDFVDE